MFEKLAQRVFILELFKYILEHYGPLSGLVWRTEKCRTKDLRGGAF